MTIQTTSTFSLKRVRSRDGKVTRLNQMKNANIAKKHKDCIREKNTRLLRENSNKSTYNLN